MSDKLRSHNIFLLDDHPVVRDILSASLDRRGHRVVVEAGSCGEARGLMDEIQAQGVTASILDNRLGDGSGSEIAEELRKRGLGGVLISHSTSEDLTWADHHVSKMGRTRDLFDLLARI